MQTSEPPNSSREGVSLRNGERHAGSAPSARRRLLRRIVAIALSIALLSVVLYGGLSAFISTQLVYAPRSPVRSSPAAYGLSYHDVTFPARTDHLRIAGWFIPGVLPGGALTARRTLILVHGTRTNRADTGVGELPLSIALAKSGFAVLAFDMRGTGESASAPLSMGQFEQRDVLGAVDFLRSGPLPYPSLGRPRAIGGWGVSMGGATLLLAAAREPAIRAVVSDSAYDDVTPLLDQQLPKQAHLPPIFTPGVLASVHALYGIDLAQSRPLGVIGRIAPRPLLLIHGASDTLVSPSDLSRLAEAARRAPGARVSTWLVPGADHAQSYHVTSQQYVDRLTSFFTSALGTDGPSS